MSTREEGTNRQSSEVVHNNSNNDNNSNEPMMMLDHDNEGRDVIDTTRKRPAPPRTGEDHHEADVDDDEANDDDDTTALPPVRGDSDDEEHTDYENNDNRSKNTKGANNYDNHNYYYHHGQDPVAEGEEQPKQEPEPSYENANAMSFFALCRALEKQWWIHHPETRKAMLTRKRKQSNKKSSAAPTALPSEEEKLKAFLPPQGLQQLSQPQADGRPQSLFPLFRLIMPDRDASRSCKMKEIALLKAYTGAFHIPKQSQDYQKLERYGDFQLVRDPYAVGDFSAVLKLVLEGRLVYDRTGKTGSDFTVADINAALDELAALPHQVNTTTTAIGSTTTTTVTTSPSRRNPKKPSLADRRSEWVRRLNPIPTKTHPKKGLTPLEHKWLVRIIKQEMRFGLGWKRVLQWYNPHAIALYDAHTSLKAICKILANPKFEPTSHHRLDMHERSGIEERDNTLHRLPYLLTSKVAPSFGKPFTPMRSDRTSFQRCLDHISARHRGFVQSLRESGVAEHPALHSLSFMHPAFVAETKLDGERMIAHITHDGIVKIHSRVGNWYSDLYSPVLGPALRRSLANYKVDVILDGEILAWDDERRETIPFGSNRTVATLRQKWMRAHGMLDSRDWGLHNDDVDSNIMKATHFSKDATQRGDSDGIALAGQECWLQFVAFDILYLDGPDAASFLEETVSPHVKDRPRPGSIAHLELMERKRLLYRLIEEQENEVVIVATWVIRPNGDTVVGKDYFASDSLIKQCGHPFHHLDSLYWTIQQDPRVVKEIDLDRRRYKSNEQISESRAWSVNKLYSSMVEDRRMEGLLFKDLSTPYYLGDESKSLAYWHKFKPDYYNGAVASDLDLVIIGAYFCSGLRHSGYPSSFLCAAVDSEDGERFFPVCKVNAGSMSNEVLKDFFASTGYVKDDSTEISQVGHWYAEEDRRSIPDFVTNRVILPDQETNCGWKPKKIDTPDLWIHPHKSRIITLNAGEIVASDAFSAGITLRFPRVTALRERSEKPVGEIESEYSLWVIFKETLHRRSSSGNRPVGDVGAISMHPEDFSLCRFLTEEQYVSSKRQSRKLTSSRKRFHVVTAPVDEMPTTNTLQGIHFTVLDGTYILDESEIDEDEAMQLQWLGEAKKVESSLDVSCFIKRHSGLVLINPDDRAYVLGGRKDDPKVLSYIDAIEKAAARVAQRKSRTPQTATAARDERIASSRGVLRWHFAYLLVYRKQMKILETQREENTNQPSILDYLARPRKVNRDSCEDLVSDLCSETIPTVGYLKRALAVIHRSFPERIPPLEWQNRALHELLPTERWIVRTRRQKLWPYKSRSQTDKPLTVVYPDVDSNAQNESVLPLGEHHTHDRIESVVPLVKVMGGRISYDLGVDVTHVLCDLGIAEEMIEYTRDLTHDIFLDKDRGHHLLDRLSSLVPSKSGSILLVSPQWIRKLFTELSR